MVGFQSGFRSRARKDGKVPMETTASAPLPRASYGSACPPLSPVAYVLIILLPYLAQVFGNAVTLRQIEYNRTFYEKYGQSIEPLPDTSILQKVTLPEFSSRLAMRDWVNVLCALWCVSTFMLWCCRGTTRWLNFTTYLAAQTILVPLYSVSQWLTTVPDSDPQCLETISVPDGTGWIWTRFSIYQCGDMMWSSAIVQSVLFSYLAFGNVTSNCLFFFHIIFTSCFLLFISIVAWIGRYQYICDIMLSMFLTLLTVTHPSVEALGHFLFTTDCSERRLNPRDSAAHNLISRRKKKQREERDEEFGITLSEDEDE